MTKKANDKVVEIRKNSRIKKDAVREELLSIMKRNRGVLLPADVVTRASNPKSVLHKHFEWDDSEAAYEHRMWQARNLINKVELTIIRKDPKTKREITITTRQFQSRKSKRYGGGGYESIEDIMRSPKKRAEMVAQVTYELDAYRERYKDLTELNNIWSAIEVVSSTISSPDRKAKRA